MDLEFEERPVLGEEDVLPVLAAGLVEGLQGVVDPTRLVHVLGPKQDGNVPTHNLHIHKVLKTVMDAIGARVSSETPHNGIP